MPVVNRFDSEGPSPDLIAKSGINDLPCEECGAAPGEQCRGMPVDRIHRCRYAWAVKFASFWWKRLVRDARENS